MPSRSFLGFAFSFTLLISPSLFSQPKMVDWSTRNPFPAFQLSPDGKSMAMSNLTEEEKRWVAILDLTTMTWRSTIILSKLKLTPDFSAAVENWIKLDGYKGSEGWVPFKKHVVNYWTDLSGNGIKTQWPDKYLVIATMPDGNLLVSEKYKTNKIKYSDELGLDIMDVKIVDPKTNAVVKTIKDGVYFKHYGRFFNDIKSVTPNGKFVVWHDAALTALPLEGGRSVAFTVPYSGVQGYAGDYAICVGRRNAFEGYRDNQLTLVDLSTGKAAVDSTLEAKTEKNVWGTASSGRIFVMKESTNELLEFEMQSGKLVHLKTINLEETGSPLSSSYYGKKNVLLVSVAASKIFLMPNEYTPEGNQNEAYTWDLNTGKLLYKATSFIRPYDSYLAKLNQQKSYTPPPPRLSIAAGMLVQSGGRYYILNEFNRYSGQWFAQALTKNRHGVWERQSVSKPEQFFSDRVAQAVSNTKCSQCNGGGSQVGYQQRTTEKTDKMIYTKITTTTTSNVAVQQACSACSGLGFIIK